MILLYGNTPPIFLLKMKNYFLNCVVKDVLCNRVSVGSSRGNPLAPLSCRYTIPLPLGIPSSPM